MRSLSLTFWLLGLMAFNLDAQSPHGPDLKMNCAACHTSESWDIPADLWDFAASEDITDSGIAADSLRFNHFNTDFSLQGQHAFVDCRSCHETLVFSEASPECISCHTDMHSQTVGSDCARCHSSENWMVDNITELHQENGFPLLGVHASLSCNDCHISDSDLKFDRIGNDCINCHLNDYNATTSPNHQSSGFSTDCAECHKLDGADWSSENINHEFFPLTKGHDLASCSECHTSGNFSGLSNECIACHQQDYNNAQNPNHQGSNFPTTCLDCHTTDVGWMPANFPDHDANYFPINSGKHEGEWSECVDCHTTPGIYSTFSCIVCHEHNDKPEVDDDHDEVSGYEYSSQACYACHPTGEE